MFITINELFIYFLALFTLVMSPGPIVAAVISRVLAYGLRAALPIACAVMLGDFLWLNAAIFGVSTFISGNEIMMNAIKYLGGIYLIYLGIKEFLHANDEINAAEIRGGRNFLRSFWAGFVIIMSNPKAALFYIVFVPQFFEFSQLGLKDIAVIGIVTAFVPFLGNMIWAMIAHGAYSVFHSDKGRRVMRQISGVMLSLVGIAIWFL